MRSASRLPLAVVLILNTAHAQVRGNPVHQGSGPLSELSTNAGAGSGPVHQRGRSVSDGSLGGISGNAVRDGGRGGMLSGPVSDVSAGPVTAGQPVSGGGTITDAAAGAVKKDNDSPLGERISQPVRELGPLLEQMRAIQPELGGPAAEAEQESQTAEEEAVPEVQEPIEDQQPADNEEPAAEEPEASPPDGAEAALESAAPPEEPPEAEPNTEAGKPSDEHNVAPPAVEDDPRDAAEPTPAPGSH